MLRSINELSRISLSQTGCKSLTAAAAGLRRPWAADPAARQGTRPAPPALGSTSAQLRQGHPVGCRLRRAPCQARTLRYRRSLIAGPAGVPATTPPSIPCTPECCTPGGCGTTRLLPRPMQHQKTFSQQLSKPRRGLSSPQPRTGTVRLPAAARALTKVKPLRGWKSLTKHLASAGMEVLNRFWQPQPLLQVQGGERFAATV